jgi:hypothetical protein
MPPAHPSYPSMSPVNPSLRSNPSMPAVDPSSVGMPPAHPSYPSMPPVDPRMAGARDAQFTELPPVNLWRSAS